jgi:hypothetical protein
MSPAGQTVPLRRVGRRLGLTALTAIAVVFVTSTNAMAQDPCANPVALFESVKNSVQDVAEAGSP